MPLDVSEIKNRTYKQNTRDLKMNDNWRKDTTDKMKELSNAEIE